MVYNGNTWACDSHIEVHPRPTILAEKKVKRGNLKEQRKVGEKVTNTIKRKHDYGFMTEEGKSKFA